MNNQILKQSIEDVIKTNGNGEITGDVLQDVLTTIVNHFGSGSLFVGFAVPSTVPINTDVNSYYIAKEAGTYVNFGGYVLDSSEIALFSNKTGVWVAENFLSVKPYFKTLFSFKRLQSSDVDAIGMNVEDKNDGLRLLKSEFGANFTSQLVAKNTYANNDTANYYHCGLSERSYQKVIFKQNAIVGTGYFPDMGMGLSFVSTHKLDYKWSALAYLCTKPDNALYKKIVVAASNGLGTVANFESSEALPDYEIGDIIEFTFERLYHDYIVIARNLSKANEISLRISPKNNFSNYIPYNNSFISVHVASGDFIAYSWEYGWTIDNIDNYIAGDSITLGQSAVVEPLRWAAKVRNKVNNIISGGGADYIRSLRFRLQEIYVLKPKRVIIMIGGNDIILGTPTQEWKDDLDFVVHHLRENGITVALCYPSAREGAGTLINYMNTSVWLANVPKIDCNTPTAVNGTTDILRPDMDGGDALHPNNYGHQAIADAVNEWLIINS